MDVDGPKLTVRESHEGTLKYKFTSREERRNEEDERKMPSGLIVSDHICKKILRSLVPYLLRSLV